LYNHKEKNTVLANDILRKIRYSLNLKDKEMIKIFHFGKEKMDHATLRTLLKKDNEKDFQLCTPLLLNSFFDGLIIFYRGVSQKKTISNQRPDISNNNILRKIRIALAYKDTDMLEVFKRNNTILSKSELSAFFRKKEHKHYKKCGDQWLRHFLHGLALYPKRPIRTETISVKDNIWLRRKK
jgi:uncharacterized protein YehS (DUF1456 family)